MKRQPEFANLLQVLRREVPARPTLFEFFLNRRLYQQLAGAAWTEDPAPVAQGRMLIQAFRNAGYDYATVSGSLLRFPTGERHRERSISVNEGAVITDRRSFAAYPWPDPDQCDYSNLDDLAADLPAGMKLIVCGPMGVLENVMNLVGYDNLCFMIMDDPGLADEIFAAVGSRLVRHYVQAAAHATVGACISNDDWGFKTQTMLSPADMRRYVFPWHKRITAAVHAAGKPVILHSCGQLEAVLDEIIDDLHYDGKHSYEDVICPVEDAYRRWGRRIAILGGIDLGYVCRAPLPDLQRRCRAMLDLASAKGGFALGTGNSVPEYVPDERYFAMTSVALES